MMFWFMRTGCALGLAMLMWPSVSASSQVRIQRRVNVVPVPVFPTDNRGRFIPNLTAEDFEVFEDGKPQEITAFQQQSVPLATVLLVDTSGSMASSIKAVQAAATRFVQLLQPQDVAKVIQFNERVSVLADYTADKPRLQTALTQMRVGGATALLNALDYALTDLRRTVGPAGEQARKGSVLVLSDGADTASALDEADVVRKASDSSAVVYALRLLAETGEDLPRVREETSVQLLQSVATETGGRLFIGKVDELERLYTQIADELRNQYILAYVSENGTRDGTFRAIEVRFKNRREGRLRFRTGYYAPRS